MNKRTKEEENKGITLIALVITIIVLIIIAGVAVNSIFGENGILKQAQKSSILMKIKEIEEQARVSYSALKMDEIINQNEATFAKVISDLKAKGYEIEQKVDGNIVEGIVLSSNDLIMSINSAQKLNYTIYSKEGTARYFVKIEDEYYEIVMEENKISVLLDAVDLNTISGSPLKKEISLQTDENNESLIETKTLEDSNEIELKTKDKVGAVVLTAVCEGKTAACNIKINAPATGLTLSKEMVEIGRGNKEKIVATVTPTNTTDEIKWETTDENIATVSQDGEIAGINLGETTIVVTCGEFRKTIEVNVIIIKPKEGAVADRSNDFPTPYGKIDIIWLNGTSNTVTQKPNEPVLVANNESMTPVKWDKDNNLVDTKKTDSNWYNYSAATENGDNTTSKWANARTKNNSYFVWIPRYAYRITYYSDEKAESPVGYYDGYGMWNASNGKLFCTLESEMETVDYEGEKYIVHSAFQMTPKYGGWKDTKLTGFWVSKFEVVSVNSELKSSYGISITNSSTIGVCYTKARKAKYGFNGTTGTDSNVSYMNSHMIKNSEWGAVAYLAYSKFGRNAEKIATNTTYTTGGGEGELYKENAMQSTTGNPYGVYDLSGGTSEYVSAYNSPYGTTNQYLEAASWTEANGLGPKVMNQFTNQYNNGSSNWNNPRNSWGDTFSGDATKEVVVYGTTSSTSNWEGTNCDQSFYSVPFLVRGGDGRYEATDTGIFTMRPANGKVASNGRVYGLRTVLTP